MSGQASEPGQRSLRQSLRLAALRLAGRAYDKDAGRSAESPCSVLLIRPDHLGDLLFLTPALHCLREALPAARLTLLAGPWGAEAVRGNPDLDEVRLCPFPGFERRPKAGPLAPYRLLAQTARALRSDAYDAAVVLRYDHWWGAWLAAAAGIPCRAGYAWPETQPFLTEAIPYRTGRHEVEQNAALLAALAGAGNQGGFGRPGPLHYHLAEGDREWAGTWLAGHGAGPTGRAAPDIASRQEPAGRPLVGIHVGAGAAVKQWPPAAWAAVARGLQAALNARVLLTGGPGEKPLAAAIAGDLAEKPLNAAGETATTGQLAALLANCNLVLGSDSGPLHLAVAVGAATLHLYGPVAVTKFGPWGDPDRHRVLTAAWACVPCNRLDWPAADLRFHGCMPAISVERVLREARDMLRGVRERA